MPRHPDAALIMEDMMAEIRTLSVPLAINRTPEQALSQEYQIWRSHMIKAGKLDSPTRKVSLEHDLFLIGRLPNPSWLPGELVELAYDELIFDNDPPEWVAARVRERTKLRWPF